MLEVLYVFLLERQDIVLVLRGLDIIKVLINDSNENVHEDEECDELETDPKEYSKPAHLFLTIMH